MSGLQRLSLPAIGLLILFGYLLFMAGNSHFSLFDNSETHYSHVARSMALSGDLLTLHFNGEKWFVHPPLYFWLSSALNQVFGWNEYNLRFWEGVFGIIGLLLTYLLARPYFGNRTAVTAGLILGSSFLYLAIARMAIFDTLLNAFILLACWAFLWAWREPEKKNLAFLVLAIACALGVMTKGPIGIVHPGMVFFVFLLIKKQLSFLWDRITLLSVLLFLVLVCPWYAFQLLTNGTAFFNVALREYTWYRFFGVVENQAGAWYYYFPMLLGFLPWVFFWPQAVRSALKNNERPAAASTQDFVLFSLLFIVLTFIFFSIAGTKLPNYILSIAPFASILTARLFTSGNLRQHLLSGSAALFGFSLLLSLFTARVILPFPYAADKLLLLVMPSLLLCLASLALAVNLIQPKKVQTVLLGGMCVLTLTLVFFFLPQIEKYKEPLMFTKIIHARPGTKLVANYQGFSPTLMYYLSQRVEHPTTLDEVEDLIMNQIADIYLVYPNSTLEALAGIIPTFTVLNRNYTHSLMLIPNPTP